MGILKLPGKMFGAASFAFMRWVLWNINEPVFIVLLGGPGAGKGTLAAQLAELLGLSHVSTGNLFRYEIAQGTSLGKVVEPILSSGGLVPDEITIAVLAEELMRFRNRKGAILDGFPRTEAQALLLDNMLQGWGQKVHIVFFLDLEKGDLVVRLSGRRTCKKCGHSHHILFDPPRVENVCDKCGGELYQRPDDNADVIEVRYEKFTKANNPIVAHYKLLKVLKEIKTTNMDGKEVVLEKVLAHFPGRRR